MRKTIATICLVLLVLLCCGSGGAVVGQANQMQVAEAVKFGSWIIYRYNKSTDMHSVVTTTSTSYNSSGIPSGTTVVTEETEYTLNYNPYDE